MIWMLTEEEVAKHWDLIKWAAYQVNKPLEPEKYFVGLLKEIYIGKAQVWFFADDQRNIKAIGISKIVADISGTKSILFDTAYGFSPLTPEERLEAYQVGQKFAQNMGITSIIAYVSHPKVAEITKAAGLIKTKEVYELRWKGDR
jgi:hypothetical protein